VSIVNEVKLELSEMQKLGITVPSAAFIEAENAEEYEGMSVGEIASFCIELS